MTCLPIPWFCLFAGSCVEYPRSSVSIVLAGGCSARKSIEQFEQDDDRKNVRGDCRKKGQKVQWLGRGLLQHRLVLLEGHV